MGTNSNIIYVKSKLNNEFTIQVTLKYEYKQDVTELLASRVKKKSHYKVDSLLILKYIVDPVSDNDVPDGESDNEK